MSKGWLRFGELVVLAGIALALLFLAGLMIYLDRMGEAFGTLLGVVPLVIQAIRGIGQSEAMAKMADDLAKSRLDTGNTVQPVEVKNPPSQPVPTIDVPEGER